MKRVLNLYAGIGGNRKLWQDVEVTAVELDPQIAAVYQDFFPNDKVIVGDAHEYLLKHYKEFDFIWSSPPCQSHSRIRKMASKNGDYDAVMPNMNLWSEILFLQHFAQNKWVVENVIPYYKPLIEPICELDRHLFWANFIVSKYNPPKERRHNYIKSSDTVYGFNLASYAVQMNKVQMLRNCVHPELGKHIFDCAFSAKQSPLFETAFTQTELFQ